MFLSFLRYYKILLWGIIPQGKLLLIPPLCLLTLPTYSWSSSPAVLSQARKVLEGFLGRMREHLSSNPEHTLHDILLVQTREEAGTGLRPREQGTPSHCLPRRPCFPCLLLAGRCTPFQTGDISPTPNHQKHPSLSLHPPRPFHKERKRILSWTASTVYNPKVGWSWNAEAKK